MYSITSVLWFVAAAFIAGTALTALLMIRKASATEYPYLCRKHAWGYEKSENTPCPICNRYLKGKV